MDSNSNLGPQYIPDDPHQVSTNGRILRDIIERHVLIVANGSTKCSGLITRQRNITTRMEKSCIDLLIFSSDLGNLKNLKIHKKSQKNPESKNI